MKTYSYCTADVFTQSIFGGNPLAVVFDADDLDTPTMQKIAREFNYSETTFLYTPRAKQAAAGVPHFGVRIFTPFRELPFAGHPTIGTAAVLAHSGRVKFTPGQNLTSEDVNIILEEQVGDVPVTLTRRSNENGDVFFARLTAARPIEFSPEPAPDISVLANVLALDPEEIGARDAHGNLYLPRGAATGIPSLNVPVRDRAVLARARIRFDVWERDLKNTWAPDPYLFTFAENSGDTLPDLYARKFALTAGVGEDPATGSAATTLAGYLAHAMPSVCDAMDGEFNWRIHQGYEMGRPSLLAARAVKAGRRILSLGVGGDSRVVCTGTFQI